MTIAAPRFTLADADHAHEEWGMNCGPSALAAIFGMTLDEVRPHMGDFERKHYTNPTLMIAALRSIRCVWRKRASGWPIYGLARIQWEGPWTKSGVPMRARYRYTHWVGAATRSNEVGVFDINAMANGTGWCSLHDWEDVIVPHILKQYPAASGAWHITHSMEVQPEAKITRTV
jgi:hypothetical protein